MLNVSFDCSLELAEGLALRTNVKNNPLVLSLSKDGGNYIVCVLRLFS